MQDVTTKLYDLIVVGGGVGGVIAAVSAARHGLHVALVNDRPGLGGNASSDIGVSIDGAICFNHFPNMREGGPLEELKEQIAVLDPFQCILATQLRRVTAKMRRMPDMATRISVGARGDAGGLQVKCRRLASVHNPHPFEHGEAA